IPVVLFFYIHGLFLGAPTVFIPQLRREANSTDVISISMESWLCKFFFSSKQNNITSAILFSSLPWSFILPVIAHKFGRKKTAIILSLVVTISTIMLYCSVTPLQILLSQIVFGILPAAHVVTSIMILTEYFSPKYRGIFMTVKSATSYWGIWTSNAVGTFFHWKNIAIISFVCCIINLSIIFWPESPYWLATKGRFEECSTAHRWLKGTGEDAEKELFNLIQSQKVYIKRQTTPDQNNISKYCKLLNTMLKSKKFYMPIWYCLLATALFHLSGKMACSLYAISIIRRITSSDSMAYNGMLILDGFTVFGMYLGSLSTKFFKRRTLLITASSIGAAFMFIISLYLYLIEYSVIEESHYLSIFLLTVYSLSVSCGPLIMCMCITGELTPLQNRSTFLGILCFFFNILMGLVIKVAPYMFQSFGLRGAFLFYGICSFILIYLLYIYLPETKDKTIIEIEGYFEDITEAKEEKEL
ncbi:unnamed protein product, partial [Leptidea sinapis]